MSVRKVFAILAVALMLSVSFVGTAVAAEGNGMSIALYKNGQEYSGPIMTVNPHFVTETIDDKTYWILGQNTKLSDDTVTLKATYPEDPSFVFDCNAEIVSGTIGYLSVTGIHIVLSDGTGNVAYADLTEFNQYKIHFTTYQGKEIKCGVSYTISIFTLDAYFKDEAPTAAQGILFRFTPTAVIPVTVTFDANGHGTPATQTKEVIFTEPYGTLPTVTPDTGYAFDGWYTDPTGGTKVLETTKVPLSTPHTLYAHWEKAKLSVSIPMGGTAYLVENWKSLPTTIEYGSDYEFEFRIAQGYEVEGEMTLYVDGRYESAEIVQYGDHHKAIIHNVTSNVNTAYVLGLVAKEYNIHIYDGTTEVRTITATYNEMMDDIAEPFVKEGSVYAGCYIDSEFKKTMYFDQSYKCVHTWDLAGEGYLFIKWADASKQYTLSYDLNGGSGSLPQSVKVVAGTSYTIDPSEDYTKSGYKFSGWSDGTREYKPGSSIVMGSENIVLTAVWKVREEVKPTDTITIEGTVQDPKGGGLAYVDIYIDGNYVGYTDSGGQFYISNVTKTSHSLVAKMILGGREIIETMLIDPADQTKISVTITMGIDQVNSVVEVSTGSSFDTEPPVGNLDVEAKNHAVTGSEVEIKLVYDDSSEKISEIDNEVESMKEKILVTIGDQSLINDYQFFDVSIVKTVKTPTQTPGYYEITTEKITSTNNIIEITIPFDATNKTNIVVTHYHGSESTVVKEIYDNDASLRVNNTYFIKGGLVHIFVNEFSSFGIGYGLLDKGQIVVGFDPNGGLASPFTYKSVTPGEQYGTLPTATKEGLKFDGWYTAAEGGERVDETTIVEATSDHWLYAHWSEEPGDTPGTDYFFIILVILIFAVLLFLLAIMFIVSSRKNDETLDEIVESLSTIDDAEHVADYYALGRVNRALSRDGRKKLTKEKFVKMTVGAFRRTYGN